jgi:hypothetical protein
MTLKVTRSPSGYLAAVEPPHGERWTATSPITPTAILEELAQRGVHSTDATDALDAADAEWVRAGNDLTPTWLELHDGEVRKRRGLK